ncbi:DHX57 [Symbiodinium sp. CCMP2592]|nr:DHX57 [Symbiodinium sp. CCMP2592]
MQAPLHVDPLQLRLAPGSFTTASDSPLGQLAFNEVCAQATGICFCTTAQAAPFVAQAKNLSVDPLALVTTAEISADQVGTARVKSIRYPAIFAPTEEAVLVAGSLIQLGDDDVQLATAGIAELDRIDTIVCRLNLFKDESTLAWDKVAEAPIRVLLQQIPALRVCVDPSCSQACGCFHSAVDEVVEHLFLDIWARQWCRLGGARVKATEADVFQAYVRVPASAVTHLLKLVHTGLYFEPRACDGTGPHPAWSVVWLPGASLATAQHALRTTEKALALARLGTKYGLRTREADEQQVFELHRPQHQFLKVRVSAHYRLHPLPHGLQRPALVQLLKQWGWNGKPLQPDRGDSIGAAWLVGASCEPPAPALPLGTDFVLISKLRDIGASGKSAPLPVYASLRTKKALLLDDDESSVDPWSCGPDPWTLAKPPANSTAAPSASASTASTKLEQIKADLRQDLQQLVSDQLDAKQANDPPPGLSDHDHRLHQLEVGLSEVRHQNVKFESWFQSFGTKVSDQAQQIQTLAGTVKEQHQELTKVRTDVQSSIKSAVVALQTDLSAQMLLWSPAAFRYGEAAHPGPPPSFFLSTSNPSGLRNKESFFADWGVGIHCFAETQLSAATLPASKAHFRRHAKDMGRLARFVPGAPAPLRTNSLWAGAWTGVLQVSDFPCRPHQISYPSGLFESGRIVLARHYLEAVMFQVATLYGYPSGPTWPDARHRTDDMLQCLTQELVLGSRGPRVITGDFNHDFGCLDQCAIWRSHGWIELQCLAESHWGMTPRPTCKHATRRDYIWLSPEAAACCVHASVLDVFQEHSTLIAGFSLSGHAVSEITWPLPSEIPWSEVSVEEWHLAGVHEPTPASDPTVWYSKFSHATERSLKGFVPGLPNNHIPSCCFGRGRRLTPQVQQHSDPIPKPSRPGEVMMRHDGLCTEVKRWFQQLRRLQSLTHALKAAKSEPAAVDYRLALWRSICRAKGFCGGFSAWWAKRPTRLVGSPTMLPQTVPDSGTATCLFEDFRCNYRRLEAWHLQRRGQILSCKYDKSLSQLYCELREPAPEQVDTLTVSRDYAILAVSDKQVHLSSSLDLRGSSTWAVDGQPVEICEVDDVVCTLSVPACPGQELEQTQTLSSVPDIHSEFVSLWASRWQQHATLTAPDWQRFLAFAAAFLPRQVFSLPRISVEDWLRAVKRFRPRAARGPDGWAKADLLNMPPPRTQQLLDFLAQLEAGECSWPQQLVVGFICLLSKQNGRADAHGYRPICLYSIIYRAWAGLRARQVLQALKHCVPDGLHGFVPGREATSLWYGIQAEIELCAQGDAPLLGLSTDIIKCFNNLPRLPLLAVAAQLGTPWQVLHPWTAFLTQTERRFLVRGQVSEPLKSTSGFPEGCPLSPLAMLLADVAYHAYMQAFVPEVRSLSYVDNLATLASTPAQLARSYQVTQSFMDLLKLSLDVAKTYTWATAPADRRVLPALGLPVSDSARELGGYLAFGPRVHNAELQLRCTALQPVWAALRRSRAPLGLKLSVLPKKCWARALHGIAGCPLGQAHLQSLRTSATSALQIRPGGSSSLLRLSIVPDMCADPGFYQLWACIRDLRRMACKVSGLLGSWRSFMAAYDGRSLHGPFTKLLQVLSQVGWAVLVPPLVMDHEGLQHDVLKAPALLLRRRLEHAWLRFVAFAHKHRATMHDLDGIDPSLLQADVGGLSALDTARYAAVRSGAFLFDHVQSRFDFTKTGDCDLCDVPDTAQHRVCVCPKFVNARRPHEWVCARWSSLPSCVTHHLLPPDNPHLPLLRKLLHGLPDLSGSFMCSGTSLGWQHLFTDGSCYDAWGNDFSLAAWGIIHAQLGVALACGPVPGVLQTAPRAEAWAMIAAAKWAISVAKPCLIWSDCLNVVDGVQAIQNGQCFEAHADADLWDILAALLAQLDPAQFQVRHTPSHLDKGLTTSPFEDWLACHNGHADTLANFANSNRPQYFVQVYQAALRYHSDMLQTLRALRGIYFAIADATASRGGRTREGVESADLEERARPLAVPRRAELESLIPVGWAQLVAAAGCDLPSDFIQTLCRFVFVQDSIAETAFTVTWLELVFMLATVEDFVYPVSGPQGGWLSPASVAFLPPPPTVAGRLTFVRRALRHAFKCLRLQCLFISGVDRTELGVTFPLDGIVIGADEHLLLRARASLGHFAQGRRVNSRAALARPL